MTDPFADIRPYRDDEVAAVVARLLGDAEFLDTIGAYRLGRVAGVLPALTRFLVRGGLRWELRGVDDVRSMQLVIERYMDRMIERSTSGFSVSGLDDLAAETACLYVSNHRDIAMDPAFVNLALHRAGRDTVRIAIGDNLLTKPWVCDLMRLNKSFVVKRSASGPRERLAAAKTLSAYIYHSVVEENAPVWIAQREGRAKNGIDRTEPAVVKMLAMHRDKQVEDFGAFIERLRIVPVAISYELDPCDALKARELHHREAFGHYRKAAQEDVQSIGLGIAGRKGQVCVAFGKPLCGPFDGADEVAAEIDRQVVSAYRLHASSLFAYRRLYGEEPPDPDALQWRQGACDETEFNARIDAMPAEHRPHALAIYANALVSKLQLPRGD